ncbi:hypothetical protein Q0590_24920 [Rhodocytophaga aerolata]|uniref:Uncharacterized protein n=1 Tax=Rhodocytophaga aerolata TaxID=455078 RepID=A0ABT8RE98_9BACT|nr:hypothetical protein [Rhodocytophaga aerolata]MDO1449543.1 hypothetical protein [Rhodocytophaga aerolata]
MFGDTEIDAIAGRIMKLEKLRNEFMRVSITDVHTFQELLYKMSDLT